MKQFGGQARQAGGVCAVKMALWDLCVKAYDLPWWESLVKMTDSKPIISKGFAPVPDSPGLGIELNEEVVKQHLDKRDNTFFAPTDEWNEKRSHDRIFS